MDMTYSYDRRQASTTSQILRLVVQKSLQGRNVESLVNAYVDELREDWEEDHPDDDVPSMGSTAEYQKWQTKTFGIIHREDDVEKLMSDTFVTLYRSLVQHPVSSETALEVFQVPQGFPLEGVPSAIIVEVGKALAKRDAAEANLMREMVRQRQ